MIAKAKVWIKINKEEKKCKINIEFVLERIFQ